MKMLITYIPHSEEHFQLFLIVQINYHQGVLSAKALLKRTARLSHFDGLSIGTACCIIHAFH